MATMAMVNPSERSGLNPRRSLVLLRLSPSPHKSPNLGTIKVCFYWKAGRCTRHPCPFLHGVPQHPNVGSMRKHSVGPDHLVPPVEKSHQGTGRVWRNPSAGPKPSAPSPKRVCMMKCPAVAVDRSVSTPKVACDRNVEVNGKTCTVATRKGGSGEIKPNANSKPNVPSSKGICKINQQCNAKPQAVPLNHYGCSVEDVCDSNLGSNAKAPAVATNKDSKEINEGEARLCGNTREVICKNFISGNCSNGESCRDKHSWCISDSFSLLACLGGHSKAVTGITMVSGYGKLFSGSNDKTVKIWDCWTRQCVQVVTMEGEVGCIISEGQGFLLGSLMLLRTQGSGLCLDSRQQHTLCWDRDKCCFKPAATLRGHKKAVFSFIVGAHRLYSGSMDCTIRVWDLATFQCTHTLTGHESVVMSLLCWDQFLFSCSLDGTVKVWAATEKNGIEVEYTHKEEHGVLVLHGMNDAKASPVLMCSCNDNVVRVYDLPSFNERGRIFSKEEVRILEIGPGGLFFTGDGAGELKDYVVGQKRDDSYFFLYNRTFSLSNLYKSLIFLSCSFFIIHMIPKKRDLQNNLGTTIVPSTISTQRFVMLGLSIEMYQYAILVLALQFQWIMMHMSM
ncbi:Zinc finger CCCH domain-containing protein 17, partial [Ananas comosus]